VSSFWRARYPRTIPAKRISLNVCAPHRPGTAEEAEEVEEVEEKRGTEVDVPQTAWSEKRERQYEHIKEGLRKQGRTEDTAEEIAARTVNKERARSGEARTASRTSVDDLSSGRRGGLRSHSGPGGRTYRQLYEEAKDRGIDGRSKMSKAQLERLLDRRR
jgi:DNA-binding protein H-NS